MYSRPAFAKFCCDARKRRGEGEKGRRGEGETRRIHLRVSASPRLRVTPSASPRHPFSASHPHSASQLNTLDHTDPVTVVEIPVAEFRNKRKHLIRKSADVQNIATLLGLRVSVRLDVDTNELRIAVTR